MGLSRNKVAVPEGAAGSPPFYGVLWARCRVPIWGCFTAWLPAGWCPLLAGKRSRRLRPCGVGGRWCGACCWVPGPPGPLCGGWCSVPAVLAVPLCGVGAWGGVVWWFENWRVDASMNGVPLWGVPGVFVLLILSNRCVPAFGWVRGLCSRVFW